MCPLAPLAEAAAAAAAVAEHAVAASIASHHLMTLDDVPRRHTEEVESRVAQQRADTEVRKT
jgi:hypothetical protein